MLDDLVKKGKLESNYADDFRGALHARQQAEYNYDYPRGNAVQLVETAEEFVKRMKKLFEQL